MKCSSSVKRGESREGRIVKSWRFLGEVFSRIGWVWIEKEAGGKGKGNGAQPLPWPCPPTHARRSHSPADGACSIQSQTTNLGLGLVGPELLRELFVVGGGVPLHQVLQLRQLHLGWWWWCGVGCLFVVGLGWVGLGVGGGLEWVGTWRLGLDGGGGWDGSVPPSTSSPPTQHIYAGKDARNGKRRTHARTTSSTRGAMMALCFPSYC